MSAVFIPVSKDVFVIFIVFIGKMCAVLTQVK